MTDVRTVAAGGPHSMVLLGDGTVWEWGTLFVESPTRDPCPIGAGPWYCDLEPTKVTLPTKAAAIEAGDRVAFAILADGGGHVCRWGWDRWGRFGGGPTTPETTGTPLCPDQNNPRLERPNHLLGVSEHGHTLALESGPPQLKVWAWGTNDSAQLGQSPTLGRSDEPLVVNGLPTDVLQVAAGFKFSLALDASGQVWGWGRAGECQLTTKVQTTGDSVEKPTKIPDATSVFAIAAGFEHVVALKQDGTVWTWGGTNSRGELGRPSGPAFICGGHVEQVAGIDDVVAVAAGGAFSLALRRDGTVWAWGDNQLGQLGATTTDPCVCSFTPVQVQDVTEATQIAAGWNHGVAIGHEPRTDDGTSVTTGP